MYNSEHGQDRYLNEKIFKNMRDGVFVEFGAIDGLITSNSLFFERELGWTGLCIEPIPEMYEKLKQNRKCICEQYAIAEAEGKEEFMENKDCVGWSGLHRTIENEHWERISKQAPTVDIITVPTTTIGTLLEKHKLYKIDYMTIDTEGNEFEIIKGFNFSQFEVAVFDIENNFGNNRVKRIMSRAGYRLQTVLGPNEIYVKRNWPFGKSIKTVDTL